MRRTMMEAFARGRDAAECEGRLRGARHNAANADLPRAELLAKLRASSASVGTPGEGVAQLGCPGYFGYPRGLSGGRVVGAWRGGR